MICAIHQPQYLPYLGFFDKMKRSDVFVFLDDCQFKKNEWQNRNRIRTKDGWQWITVPVRYRFGEEIKEIEINNNTNWRNKHLQALQTNYGRAPCFKKHIDFFREAYGKNWELLVDINLHFIGYLMEALGIKTETTLSSQLGIKTTGTRRLINITKKIGADTYLSGPGGREYLETEEFKEAGIKLVFQEFRHPEYNQQFEGFIPNLSVVDFLFNCGDIAGETSNVGGIS
ncbi:MAG: WbqC family protein [bacterium]|nr:WbqC family protein [bacterium]